MSSVFIFSARQFFFTEIWENGKFSFAIFNLTESSRKPMLILTQKGEFKTIHLHLGFICWMMFVGFFSFLCDVVRRWALETVCPRPSLATTCLLTFRL